MLFTKYRVRLILAAVVFVLSSIIAINMLLVNAPVVIEIEGDSFRVIDIPYSYTTGDAYVLLIAGFLGGVAISFMIFYFKTTQLEEPIRSFWTSSPDGQDLIDELETQVAVCGNIDILLRVLEGDERRIVEIIAGNDGRMLQNELVNLLNFSKAKVSRVLMNLERRHIIKKSKYGLTNCISLADDIRGEIK